MEFKVIPFEPFHSLGEFNPVEQIDGEHWRQNLIFFYHSGPTYTGYYGKHIVGFGGVRKYWSGVGEGWVMINRKQPDISKLALGICLVKGIREKIKEVMGFGYWRLQAFCHHEVPGAEKLLKAIGFKFEGNLKKFNPDGSDSLIYAYTKD